MTHTRKHMQWLRLGLLAALLVVIILLPGVPSRTYGQSGGSISYGTKVFGTISTDVPHSTFSFIGTTGDVMTAIADNWTGTLDLRAELIAPNGLIIGVSVQNTLDDNDRGAYLSAILPVDGIYLLRITSENATTGDFALTLLAHSAPASTPLNFGTAVDVTVTPNAEPQLFSFEAGDCPTILTMTDLMAGLPYTYPFVVKVYDQRGQTVALLHGGEETEDWVTVMPRSGHYEVEVSSDDSQAAGSVRLLVTCGAGSPGCSTGQASIPGVVGSEPLICTPCSAPGDTPESGGCPDLGLSVEQDGDNPLHVTVSWNALSGVTGYAVYVYGRTTDSGEVYLTHAVWNSGDPTAFTWFLPEDYVAFRFVLRVYVGDEIVCTGETGLEFETPPSQQSVCGPFTVAVTANTGTTATVAWTAFSGADAFVLTVLDSAHTMRAGWPVIVSETQLSLDLELPPGDYFFRVGPWTESEGMFCEQEVPISFGGELVCAIRTDRSDVPMRIGPGIGHAVFAYMPSNTELRVIGQTQDSSGTRWWQLDLTGVPGGAMAGSLWVRQDQVEADPICGQVPMGQIPQVEPPPPQQGEQQPPPPDQGEQPPAGPGQWLPCGSCSTCGHPANECVTSPEGVCLWDPGTCSQPPEEQHEEEDGGDEGEELQCVGIGIATNPPGVAPVRLSAGNCFSELPGNYRVGTTVRAQYTPTKCKFTGWSGCTGGSSNPVSFTANSNCTVIANFDCH